MKISTILAIIFLFFSTPQIFAQAQVYNQSNHNLSLVYQGEKISILAKEATIWPNAPQGEFIAFLYQQVADYPALIIEKTGFVLLKNDHNLLILYENIEALPAYLTNLSEDEIVLEYGKRAIFLPAGRTTLLEDIFLNSEAKASILVSNYSQQILSASKMVTIQFEVIENSSFRAIWE